MSSEVTTPKGWSRVALGDVATEYSVRVDNPAESDYERFVGSNHIGRFELSVSDWGRTSEVSSAMKVFQPGDYLLVRRSLYASDFRERAARADFEGVCSGDILTIRENAEVVAPGFLSAVINTPEIWAYIVAHATGSITRRIKWRQLREYEFALPPLEEQRRIVEVLQAAEAAKDSYKAIVLSLRRIAEAISHRKASSFAQTYPLVNLEEVADVRYGLTVNQARRKVDSQAPYLRVANVLRGALDLSEIKEIGVLSNDDGFILQHGDVLIVEGHANPTAIGRAAVWLNSIPGMMHQNHLIRARCSEALSHHFLCMLINSPHGMVYFRSRAKSSSGLNTINSTVVKNYRVPLPPREVQDRVVRELSAISDAEAVAVKRLGQLKMLSAQLLRWATGGQS